MGQNARINCILASTTLMSQVVYLQIDIRSPKTRKWHLSNFLLEVPGLMGIMVTEIKECFSEE